MRRRLFLREYKLPALAAIRACRDWRTADDARTSFLDARPYLHSPRQYREFCSDTLDAVEEKMDDAPPREPVGKIVDNSD